MKFPETKQEIFDAVVAHLRTQKSVSLDSKGMCAYRGKNGLKCVVGAFITDEEYSSRLEGKSVSLISCGVNRFTKFDKNLEFWGEMQMVHDFNEVSDWETKLSKIAKTHELKYTAP